MIAPDPEAMEDFISETEADFEALEEYDDLDDVVRLLVSLDVARVDDDMFNDDPDGLHDVLTDVTDEWTKTIIELRTGRDCTVERVEPTDPETGICGYRIEGPDGEVLYEPEQAREELGLA